MKSRHRKFILWFHRAKPISAKVRQMHQCTGLDLKECHESLEAIRQNIGDICLRGANEKLFKLILNYRKVGYTPRRAAFKAIQDFYNAA